MPSLAGGRPSLLELENFDDGITIQSLAALVVVEAPRRALVHREIVFDGAPVGERAEIITMIKRKSR
ncbi:MAG TPA: hypothetical protein VL069_03620 [Opitutus sp.]|nr:hypothetical protein [Opitutus sp.]